MTESISQIARRSWLSNLPKSWDVQPVKRLFTLTKEVSHIENPQVLSLTRSGVKERDISGNEGQIASSYIGYASVKPGDFVLNPMDLIAGWVAITPYEGVVSNAYITFRPDKKSGRIQCEPRYFEYLFGAYYQQRILNPFGRGLGRSESGGGRWTINSSTFLNFPIPVPPLEEQKSISDFLDRELARIDQVLENNARLISTLKVKQRAVIWSQLGIKSQTPDTGSRYSPVFEHVQDVWPLVPFKSISRQKKSLVGDTWGSYQLLSLTRGGVITRDPESGVGKFPTEFDGYQIVEPMDLVFCLFDVAETPRTVGLVKQRGMITAAYTRYQLDRHKVDPEWLELLFIAMDDEKLFQPFYTGLRNTVPKEVLGSTLLPLPSLEEQGRIVESVKRTNQTLAELMHKALDFEITLRQRRDALISSAVTGKIDVQRKS